MLTLCRLGLPPPRSGGAHRWIGFLRTLPTAQHQLHPHRLTPMSCGQRRQQAARDRLGTVAGQGCSSATADVQMSDGHRAIGADVITEQLGVGCSHTRLPNQPHPRQVRQGQGLDIAQCARQSADPPAHRASTADEFAGHHRATWQRGHRSEESLHPSLIHRYRQL
ncbi:hypothetical protein BKH03_02715 [Actinomyces naeslundii]|nr:hypothetical protein BKH03_02715 [Actinomyces naeslundii]